MTKTFYKHKFILTKYHLEKPPVSAKYVAKIRVKTGHYREH